MKQDKIINQLFRNVIDFLQNTMASPRVNNITTIVYETKGRAREYCELAANLYRGCDHGCTYCYAPSATFRKRDDFCNSIVRKDIMSKFENDVIELENNGETRPILLSFTTDPYQHLDVKEQLTRKAIELLHNHNLKVKILTKGGKRSERDFDLLCAKPKLSQYGTTLVFIDEDLRSKIEPLAASTKERIEALKKAHKMGISTFVSLEPVWTADQALELIDQTYEFVDLFNVGKLNYNKQQKEVDWKKFRHDVVEKFENYGQKYYIKKDLQMI